MKKTISIFVAVMAGTVAICWAANEITLQALLKADKNSAQVQRSPGTLNITWNGQRFNSQTIIATPTWQPVSRGACASSGFCYVRNMAPTNTYTISAGVTQMVTVEISFDVGVTTNLMLKQSEYSIFRLNTAFDVTNMMIKTRGATGDVEVTILED